jgi:hypothetical protein
MSPWRTYISSCTPYVRLGPYGGIVVVVLCKRLQLFLDSLSFGTIKKRAM